MIKIKNCQTAGWEPAVRGMRNPMNSWEKSDSRFMRIIGSDSMSCSDVEEAFYNDGAYIGPNDLALMQNLVKAGPDHRKFMRMIVVYMDITAPLYWWKEFETYKVGTVSNSCSTMHKIAAKEFTLEDFSCEHLMNLGPRETPFNPETDSFYAWRQTMEYVLEALNGARTQYLSQLAGGHVEFAKELWYQMIQLLPSSYNQQRTVMLNYEVLRNIYTARKDHKLDEWRNFCQVLEVLPYSELITGETDDDD